MLTNYSRCKICLKAGNGQNLYKLLDISDHDIAGANDQFKSVFHGIPVLFNWHGSYL